MREWAGNAVLQSGKDFDHSSLLVVLPVSPVYFHSIFVLNQIIPSDSILRGSYFHVI